MLTFFILNIFEKFSISNKTLFYRLTDFGYRKRGNISFFTLFPPKYNYSVVIFEKSFLSSVSSSLPNFCYHHNISVPHIHDNIVNSSFTLQINMTSILSIMIVNCNYQQIVGYAKLSNPRTELDSRDSFLPNFYLCCSGVYILITFYFVKDYYQFPNFRIIIHILFSFASFFFLSTRISLALFWKKANLGKLSNETNLIQSTIFPFCFENLLLLLNNFALSGLSVTQISPIKILGTSLLQSSLYILIHISLLPSHIYGYRLTLIRFLTLIFFLYYLGNMMLKEFSLLRNLPMEPTLTDSRSSLRLKNLLMLSYYANNLNLNLFLLIYIILAYFENFYESVSLFIKEVYFVYLLNAFIDHYCYFPEKARNIKRRNEELDISIIHLIEPHSSFFATV